MDTKSEILQTAKKMFNKDGAHKVTTNHIAAEMGISPGNFYYHFRNKEEIIRYLYRELSLEQDKIRQVLEKTEPSVSDIAEYFVDLYSILYEYRFFFLELPVLLNRDEKLRHDYVGKQKKRLDNTQYVISRWVDAGIMNMPYSQREFNLIAQNLWIVGQFWLSYLFINEEKISKDNVKHGILQVVGILKPHFNHEAAVELEQKIIEKFHLANK